MNPTNARKRSRLLSSAVASASLMALGSAAYAEPVNLTLEYSCPFPLIGDQPIIAEISADIPAEVKVGEPLGPFQIEALTTVNEDSRLGLKLVGSATIEGVATSTNIITTGAGDRQIVVPLSIPQSPIPDQSGAFTVPATGEAEQQVFDAADVGPGTISVGGLVLDMVARTASGDVAPAPIGEFTADCTQVAGQDNILQNFEVVNNDPVPDPKIEVTPDNLEFGNVQLGLSAEQSVTVANTGGAILGINAITIDGSAASAYMQTNDCTTVAPGESCTVDVTYFPSGEGEQLAELSIQSDDPDNGLVAVPMSGTSVLQPEPEISVDPQSVDFGKIQVGTSASTDITVSNVGDEVLYINGVSLDGAASSDFLQTHDCAMLTQDQACTITVTYTAPAAGISTANLVIESDDPDANVVDVALQGEGDSGSSGTVDFLLDLEGATTINANGSSLPLSGSIDAVLELATGLFTADLTIAPTEGTFQISRLFRRLTATAEVTFEQVGDTTGQLANSVLSSESQMYVQVPEVTTRLFGFKIPLGGGSECRTMDPVTIAMQTPDGETFEPLTGGNLTGTYDLPPLENCGLLTDVLNLFMAGSGNTIDLELTPNL